MKRRALVLAGILTLAAASGAGAAPLPFTATLSIQFAPVPGGYLSSIPPLVSTGSGIGNFGGAGGSASLPADVFTLDARVAIFPPLLVIAGFGLGAPGQAPPTVGVPLSPGSSHALTFGGVTGTMAVDASLYFLSASSGVTNAFAGIPLTVFGVGGIQTFDLLGMTPGSVIGNPYQLGMVTATQDFWGTPATVMGTGFDNRTAGGAGVLQLVTPTSFEFEGAGALASVTTLTIQIVPEPATLLLVALGLATLGAAARGRS